MRREGRTEKEKERCREKEREREREERAEERSAHAEGREKGHTWRVRRGTIVERENPRWWLTRGKEKQIARVKG